MGPGKNTIELMFSLQLISFEMFTGSVNSYNLTLVSLQYRSLAAPIWQSSPEDNRLLVIARSVGTAVSEIRCGEKKLEEFVVHKKAVLYSPLYRGISRDWVSTRLISNGPCLDGKQFCALNSIWTGLGLQASVVMYPWMIELIEPQMAVTMMMLDKNLNIWLDTVRTWA